MKILAIETSCDETAVAILSASKSRFKVLGNALYSQVDIHKEYGGVYPNLAKREHQSNLVPILLKALKINSKREIRDPKQILNTKVRKIEKILEREPELLRQFPTLYNIKNPELDRIAVTTGPGLEPALWVGINFAKALSILWDVPVVPVNHMRGHFLAPLADGKEIEFPALGLLISGGHTELAVAQNPLTYKLLGTTRDDAAGEAYDKVARILGLSYPGGPQVAALAAKARNSKLEIPKELQLPRPLIATCEIEFSFSGLKTAVLYMVNKLPKLDEDVRISIAKEFEEAVKDVLVAKTRLALTKVKAKTLLIGGGVSANKYICKAIEELAKDHSVKFLSSSKQLATDNAIMIGVAGFYSKVKPLSRIKAEGNLPLGK